MMLISLLVQLSFALFPKAVNATTGSDSVNVQMDAFTFIKMSKDSKNVDVIAVRNALGPNSRSRCKNTSSIGF